MGYIGDHSEEEDKPVQTTETEVKKDEPTPEPKKDEE